MTAEGVAVDGSNFKLSADLLPADTLERSQTGHKFEKLKCSQDPSLVFTEVRENGTTSLYVDIVYCCCVAYVYLALGTPLQDRQ